MGTGFHATVHVGPTPSPPGQALTLVYLGIGAFVSSYFQVQRELFLGVAAPDPSGVRERTAPRALNHPALVGMKQSVEHCAKKESVAGKGSRTPGVGSGCSDPLTPVHHCAKKESMAGKRM